MDITEEFKALPPTVEKIHRSNQRLRRDDKDREATDYRNMTQALLAIEVEIKSRGGAALSTTQAYVRRYSYVLD